MASDHTEIQVQRADSPRTVPPAPSAGPGIPSLKDRIPKLEPRRRRAPPSNATPFPVTPTLPPPPEASSLSFRIPTRRILSREDHELFLASPSYELITAWVFGLSDAVVDRPISSVKDVDLSAPVKTILLILDEAEELVRQSPPDDQGGSRFGNKRFRDFVDKAKQQAPAWHQMLGLTDASAAAEASTYLAQSFGNRTRIDYGSGHELNFLVWLLCLYRLRVLSGADRPALVLRVFARYLALMRVVQAAYYLEPAGSHGVWGLDDYQFLPFLFGAAQLLHHPYLGPLAVHQPLALEEFGADYLYLGQIDFVNATKTVDGMRWHSPMLDDISAAKSWAKVEGGMRRMFVANVLGKLPVMQHFLFGALVPAADGMTEQDEAGLPDEEDELEGGAVDVFDEGGVKHIHQRNGWGECCGIKVPSSVAAGEEMRKRQGEKLRRIPFD